MLKRSSLFALSILIVLGVAACQKKEAPKPAAAPPAPAGVSVSAITLGNAIGADKKVTAPGDSFAKSDTIYAVVETQGAGTATLTAKWTYHKGDKVADVSASEQTVTPTGPAVSEFHISKPDGWPQGDYQVEVSLNGASAGVKKFTVK
jgi:hypothetical protein